MLVMINFVLISVIFSCWTNTLNLLTRYLNQNAIRFERIDGESPLRHRQKILDDFSKSPDIRVLIMTTGTGAFGYEFFLSICSSIPLY